MSLLSSSSITKISPALLKAQKSMGDAKKDAKNPFFKSSYADLNSIREAAIPVLNEQGITVLQPMITQEGKPFVRTLLLHESGEWLASDTEIVQAKANDPQAHGSGISYARRYGLQSLLNVGAVDDDGEGAMARTKPTYTAPTKNPAPTPAAKVPAPVVTLLATADQLKISGADTPNAPEAPKKTTFKKAAKTESVAQDGADWQ